MKSNLLAIFIMLSLNLSSQSDSYSKYSKHELMEVSIGAEILSWILPVLIFVLWLISLISALKSEYKYPVDKLVWVLVSFIPLLGPILYFVIGRKQHKTEV